MARILIVEDEEKIARFVTLELEHEGYQVEHAADGRTAVDLALERNYDLILLDVLLPQLNGMEVLRRVRKHKDVPVIMVTARDAVMDKVAGLDAGADDYLTKPFAIEELFARIRVALKRSEAVRAASGVGGAGAGAGLAGSVKALIFQFATLTDVTWQMSGEVILMTLLGGIGTFLGPVVGAGLVVTLQNYLATSDFPVTIITGIVFMVCVLLFRRGLVGEFFATRLGKRLGFRASE